MGPVIAPSTTVLLSLLPSLPLREPVLPSRPFTAALDCHWPPTLLPLVEPLVPFDCSPFSFLRGSLCLADLPLWYSSTPQQWLQSSLPPSSKRLCLLAVRLLLPQLVQAAQLTCLLRLLLTHLQLVQKHQLPCCLSMKLLLASNTQQIKQQRPRLRQSLCHPQPSQQHPQLSRQHPQPSQ